MLLVQLAFLEIGAQVVDRKPPSNCPQFRILASRKLSSPNTGCRPDDYPGNLFCLKERVWQVPLAGRDFCEKANPLCNPRQQIGPVRWLTCTQVVARCEVLPGRQGTILTVPQQEGSAKIRGCTPDNGAALSPIHGPAICDILGIG